MMTTNGEEQAGAVEREENPFAAPTTGEKAFLRADEEGVTDYEADRKKHLKRETNIKAVGSLTILGGFLSLLAAAGTISTSLMSRGKGGEGADALQAMGPLMIGMGVLFLAMSVASIWGGFSVRRLKPAGRILCTIMMIFGIISLNPITIILSILFLYLLWSRPSDRIFRQDYREVVLPATPHIKYKTSLVVKILLIVFLLFIVGLILAGSMGYLK